MLEYSEISYGKFFGTSVEYIGNLPSDSCVFIVGGKYLSQKKKESIFISTLEAFKNGYDVAYIPFLELSKVVEKASLECDKGSLFAFLPQSVRKMNKKRLGTILLSGGGVISLGCEGEDFSLPLLKKTECLASLSSCCTFLFDESISSLPEYVSTSLDNGHLVLLSKESLSSPTLRKLSQEGAPIVSSFFDILANPRYLVYPKRNGKYGLSGKDYDILDIKNGK